MFPHLSGPPGYDEPRSKSQFEEEGREEAAEGVKVSRNVVLKPGLLGWEEVRGLRW